MFSVDTLRSHHVVRYPCLVLHDWETYSYVYVKYHKGNTHVQPLNILPYNLSLSIINCVYTSIVNLLFRRCPRASHFVITILVDRRLAPPPHFKQSNLDYIWNNVTVILGDPVHQPVRV